MIFFIAFLLQVDEVPFATINANTDKEVILPFSLKGQNLITIYIAERILKTSKKKMALVTAKDKLLADFRQSS